MLRSRKMFWWVGLIATLIVAVSLCDRRGARADVTSEEVEHAIREGVRFLKEKQRPTARGPTSIRPREPGRRVWSRLRS